MYGDELEVEGRIRILSTTGAISHISNGCPRIHPVRGLKGLSSIDKAHSESRARRSSGHLLENAILVLSHRLFRGDNASLPHQSVFVSGEKRRLSPAGNRPGVNIRGQGEELYVSMLLESPF